MCAFKSIFLSGSRRELKLIQMGCAQSIDVPINDHWQGKRFKELANAHKISNTKVACERSLNWFGIAWLYADSVFVIVLS